MGLAKVESFWKPHNLYTALRDSGYSTCSSGKYSSPHCLPKFNPGGLYRGFRLNVKGFSRPNQSKESRLKEKTYKKSIVLPSENAPTIADRKDTGQDTIELDSRESLEAQAFPSRSSVLQACTITSGLIAILGVIVRQISHAVSTEERSTIDSSAEISFTFQMGHLGLITELVLLVSSCRYVLLKTWPDFAESSEAANRQVLTSLEPSDYIIVAFLPGISEELLFRGALLPLFGFNWTSILSVAALFGILHVGGGRKYSFAAWATFVGVVYGYAAVLSSSVIVPMAAHSINNLVGGILWRYSSDSSD